MKKAAKVDGLSSTVRSSTEPVMRDGIDEDGKVETVSQTQKTAKFSRGTKKYDIDAIKFKRLRRTMEEVEEKIGRSLSALSDTEILLQQTKGSLRTTDGSKTYNIEQSSLDKYLVLASKRNIFDINLTEYGTYVLDFSRNGRWLAIGGKRGHIATFDCQTFTVGCEINVDDQINDVHYLHNETLIAVAQSNYVYIYDNHGTEIHCMKRHENPFKLAFLPHHFLVVSVGQSGWIKWQDVSTGEYVTGHSSKKGPCQVLKQNPANAMSILGHSDGCVSMWSPAAGKSQITMLTHRGGVSDLCVSRDGLYLATSGCDGMLKVWDLRNYQQTVHSYMLGTPAISLDISDQGLIAVGLKRGVQVLMNMTSVGALNHHYQQHVQGHQEEGGIRWRGPDDLLYMSHKLVPDSDAAARKRKRSRNGSHYDSHVVDLSCVRFRPFEDCLAIGHSNGFSSIVVPGAGEPNIDSFAANPFETTHQRREREVHMLLDKLRPDMIGLGGSSNLASHLVLSSDASRDRDALEEGVKEKRKHDDDDVKANEDSDGDAVDNKDEEEKELRTNLRKIKRRLRRRQQNVIDSDKLKMERAIEMAKNKPVNHNDDDDVYNDSEVRPSSALSRFS